MLQYKNCLHGIYIVFGVISKLGECAYIVCKYYAISLKGLGCAQVWVPIGVPGANPTHVTLRPDCPALRSALVRNLISRLYQTLVGTLVMHRQ